MGYPSFAVGDVLNASDMNAVGLWKNTTATVTSVGGTSATASNGTITIGSGNTSVTVANAFSADYANYRIIISNLVLSGTASVQFQLNNSTGTTYQMYGYYGVFGTATLNAYSPVQAARWTDVGIGNTTRGMIDMMLYNPQATTATVGTTYSVSTSDVYHFGLRDTSTNASTGFVLNFSGAQSFTSGTIRIYGYRN